MRRVGLESSTYDNGLFDSGLYHHGFRIKISFTSLSTFLEITHMKKYLNYTITYHMNIIC